MAVLYVGLGYNLWLAFIWESTAEVPHPESPPETCCCTMHEAASTDINELQVYHYSAGFFKPQTAYFGNIDLLFWEKMHFFCR